MNLIVDLVLLVDGVEMHPHIVLRWENVPRGPEVPSRWVKAD